MAHTCPDCGMQCYCGGDIDDCCNDFEDDQDGCTHCGEESWWGAEDEDGFAADAMDAPEMVSATRGGAGSTGGTGA